MYSFILYNKQMVATVGERHMLQTRSFIPRNFFDAFLSKRERNFSQRNFAYICEESEEITIL
jgi:hypothetical protein